MSRARRDAKKRSKRQKAKKDKALRLKAKRQNVLHLEPQIDTHPPDDFPHIPDRRVMEGKMREVLGGMLRTDEDSPLNRAQQIMYRAFEETDPRKQVRLARQALEVSPDCADAYSLLAEHASSQGELIELFKKAVAAGERALGEEAFQEDVGHFWGILETRPYMRARMDLAQCFWSLGRREEAIDHFQDMLRLNPNDNQGVRWILACYLLELGRDDDLYCLMKQYEGDPAATMQFSRALLAFRQNGDDHEANKLLTKAIEANAYVPAYLLGVKSIPHQLPEYVGFGDENEAVVYAANGLPCWKAAPGAISWLRKMANVPMPRPKRRKPSRQRVRKTLLELPRVEGEVWQADCYQLPNEVNIGGERMRPWMLAVANSTNRQMLAVEPVEDEPAPEMLWDTLVKCMERPSDGDPHRPQVIETKFGDFRDTWAADFEDLGIELVICDELDPLDHLLRKSAEQLAVPAEAPAGPINTDELAELPQNIGEVWQVDSRKMPTWLENDDGTIQRPRLMIVTNRTDDLILAQDMKPDRPPRQWIWEAVARAMARPAIGAPHRPGLIQARSDENANILRRYLQPLGIDCVVCADLDQLDSAFRELAGRIAGEKRIPALVEVPGVGLDQVRSYFEAAASFYQEAPWRAAPADVPIRVECDEFESGRWYAVIMGQMGMTLGLALYQDLQLLQGMLAGTFGGDKENARRTDALSLTFGEQHEMPFGDLDAIEEHGWSIAGPEAYPCAMRVMPGCAHRPPLSWELKLLEGCLSAIPDFVRLQGAARLASKTFAVPTASGELTLQLSWCSGDQE